MRQIIRICLLFTRLKIKGGIFINEKTRVFFYDSKQKKIIDKRIYDLCARCDVAKNVNIRHTPGEQIKG